jgi:hypothetical protein
MAEQADTDRAAIKTYVPSYQKEQWRDHADQLDMSLSEFVRAMVQSGRRPFELDPEGTDSPDATPRVDGLEEHVLDVLREDSCTWDELLDELSDHFADHLENTLEVLQSQNQIQYNPRKGYTLTDGADGGPR